MTFITRSALLCAAVILTPNLVHAQNYTWSATTGGIWADGTNWGNTVDNYPRNANDTAIFSSTGNSSAKTITLDQAISIRAVQFSASQTGAVTIAPGTGGSLTLTNTVGQEIALSVNTASGDHTMTANLTIAGPAPQSWDIGANRTFTMTGNIGGTNGFIKSGSGTLLLNGTNTYAGNTTIGAGTLSGSGSITGNLVSVTGATIAAGTAATTRTFTVGGNATLLGTTRVTLFSPTVANLLNVTGTADLTGGTLELALAPGVTVEAVRAAGPQTYTILDSGGLGGTTFSTTNFTSAGFLASEWTVTYDSTTGNVSLGFIPVPEPGLILGVAAAGLLGARRIRRWGAKDRATPIAA